MLLNLFSSSSQTYLFGLFGIIIIVFLAVDLGLIHKGSKVISQKDALLQTIFWVVVSFIFGGLIYQYAGGYEVALEYFSAYVTEKALSVDNIFVILLILKYFNVKEEYYHDVLFWGILGALVFRAIFIFLGALLIGQFHWILYIFGAFLVYSGIKIFNQDGEEESYDPNKNILNRWAKKVLPISSDDRGGRFVFRENGKLWFTPLFLVILLIESTDLIFAVDSIPAAFAISQNEFVVYTSNIFAVMGLRAMFFLLASVIDKFYLLQKGLSVVLIFIGVKMLLEFSLIQHCLSFIGIHDPEIPVLYSFLVIILALFLSIILSVIIPQKEENSDA